MHNEPKKCLSLWQPFADLVMLGIKTLDSRGFKTPTDYQGELYIHASAQIKRKEVYEAYYLRSPEFRLIVNCLFFFEETTGNEPVPWPRFRTRFALGVILGKVTIGKSAPSWEVKEAWENEHRHADWEREFALGDHGSGRWAWPMADPVIFQTPIAAKGTISPLLWDCSKYLSHIDDTAFRMDKAGVQLRDRINTAMKSI